MPETPAAGDAARLTAAQINAQIQALASETVLWDRDALEALAELRAAWWKARAREAALAA